MSERYDEDANPNSNQCLLVDQFLICAALKELTEDESTAMYLALLPHVRECQTCAENIKATEGLVLHLRDEAMY